jgi:hypothetical protein
VYKRSEVWVKSTDCTEFPNEQPCIWDQPNGVDECGKPITTCVSDNPIGCDTEENTEWIYNPTLFFEEDEYLRNYTIILKNKTDKLFAYNTCSKTTCKDQNDACNSETEIAGTQYLKSLVTNIFGISAEYGTLTLKGNASYPNGLLFSDVFKTGSVGKTPSFVSSSIDIQSNIDSILKERKTAVPSIGVTGSGYWVTKTIYDLVDTFNITGNKNNGITTDYYPDGIPTLYWSDKKLQINKTNGNLDVITDTKQYLNYFYPTPVWACKYI